MAISVDMKYRIKRSKAYEKEMEEFRKAKLFSSYRDILVLSAAIGYANNRFDPVDTPASDGVLMQFFENEDRNLMDLLAFLHTKNQKILYETEKYQYFEGYANGGFPVLLKLLDWVGGEEYVLSVDRKEALIKLYTQLIIGDYILNDNDFLEDV